MATAAERLQQALRDQQRTETTPTTPQRLPSDPAARGLGLSAPVAQRERGQAQQGGRVSPWLAEFGSQFVRGGTNALFPILSRLSLPGTPSVAELGRAGLAPGTPQEFAQAAPGVATEEPQTFTGRAGRLSGAAAGAAVPLGGAASLVPRAVQRGGSLLTRFARGTQNLAARSGEAFRRGPAGFTAGESVLGATAGAGGLAAERRFPDSDSARVVGELLGGIAPQVAPMRLVGRGIRAGVDRVTDPIRGAGPQRRAARAVQGAQTRAEQAGVTEELDLPTTRDPRTGDPVLTPAQRSGSQGLLALERSVRDSRQELSREAQERLARANEVLQEEARGIGAGGTPEDVTSALEEGRRRLQQSFNERLRVAAIRIDQRIEQLGRGASREQSNRIAREELDQAREAARTQERDLFGVVDPETAVPTSVSQQSLEKWRGRLGQAQQKNIPAEAKRLLQRQTGSGQNAKRNPNFLGDTTNIRELRSLQSELRAQARRARSSENFQKAEIADDIADSITDDLAAAANQSDSENLRLAVDFSRAFRQRFRRGAVGRVFGREASGGERIREGETLERTIGGGGPGERESLDELRNALTDPEVSRLTGSNAEAFNAAAADFVRRRFIERARREGEFSPQRARAFLRDNEQLLSRMPDVQQELSESIRAGNLQQIVRNRRQSTRFDDPRVSRAALFIRKGPVQAFDEIASDSPARAGRETQQLINRARRDETGRATAGLKRGYVDFLMRSETARDVSGRPFVSGFRLRERRQSPSVQAAEKRLLSEGERERLSTIERDLIRLERARQAPSAGELPVSDQPGKLRQRLARIAGAATGRQTAAATGSGGTVQIPGQVADIFNDMVNAGFEDPAGRLLRDAVDDDRLWRDLIQAEIDPDGQLPKKARNRLQAWAAGVLAEQQQVPEQRPEPEIPNAPAAERLRNLLGE